MSEKIILSSLEEKIEYLANHYCPGCQNQAASFKNHACYTDTWYTKVFRFFDEAIEFVPEAQKYSRDFLFNALLDDTGIN